MKIAIVYSPDPIYLGPFIARILKDYHQHIVAVVCTEGKILHKRTWWQRLEYAVTLPLILGFRQTLVNTMTMLRHRIRKNAEIETLCQEYEIAFRRARTINAKEIEDFLSSLQPDVIFNQSHHIVKKSILAIPRIGVLNRHGAYLPRYRGRLAPFWQLLHGEAYGGLTYHLLDEGIDSGPIVYQEQILLTPSDNFNTLVRKMFDVAVLRFGIVLEILESPYWQQKLIPNDASHASYYSSPHLTDALRYRWRRLTHGRT